ncbi:MAG: hypothetical protein PHF79_01730 [Candidatus Pacebacteria bacterium]|nr:hypothetical protein [Candidatus Paceibacterota bacterium]
MKVILSPFNLFLFFVSLIGLATALWRMFPLQFSKSFWWSNGPLVLMLVTGVVLIYMSGKPHQFTVAMRAVIGTSSRMLPMMILLFAVMGLSGVVTDLYFHQIVTKFQDHPRLISVLSCFVIPTPNSMSPVIDRLWKVESLQRYIMYFSMVTTLLSFCLLQLRIVGFSPGSPIPAQIYSTGVAVAIMLYPQMAIAMKLGNLILQGWTKTGELLATVWASCSWLVNQTWI